MVFSFHANHHQTVEALTSDLQTSVQAFIVQTSTRLRSAMAIQALHQSVCAY
jgi:hypothetical protein